MRQNRQGDREKGRRRRCCPQLLYRPVRHLSPFLNLAAPRHTPRRHHLCSPPTEQPPRRQLPPTVIVVGRAGTCGSGGEDRISNLPDDQLCLVLRWLDTHTAVATGALLFSSPLPLARRRSWCSGEAGCGGTADDPTKAMAVGPARRRPKGGQAASGGWGEKAGAARRCRGGTG
uniref:F-box domain-containing protein n=1 Tax=Oryza rufipogon TaxID=4529 RepID=A0A0E0Q8I4_ORYRU